jgi:uncharacterized protein (TIGR03083 family)
MQQKQYLEHIAPDADAILAAAGSGLHLPVPSCDGWTVRDVVLHVAQVYQHKIACMERGRAPDPWPPDWPIDDPVGWLRESRDELLAELAARGPEAPSYTWFPPDQTVAFWFRRMAHETAVHRVDVQLASGRPAPVDAELALDGIDELFDVMLAGDWSDAPQPHSVGTVRVAAADRAWLVELASEQVTVHHDPVTTDALTTVEGTPSDVLLWLWGRAPVTALRTTGDPAGTDRLRARVILATQ